MNKYLTFIYCSVITLKSSIYIGCSLWLLPSGIAKVYYSIYFRIFRFGGSLSLILYLTGGYLLFSFSYVIFLITVFHCSQIIITSLLKVIYCIYIIRNNVYNLEVDTRHVVYFIIVLRVIILCCVELFGLSEQIEIFLCLYELKNTFVEHRK